MLDRMADRVRAWLGDLPRETPNREVGEAFDVAFADDEEVSSWARRALGIREWAHLLGKGRPAVMREGIDGERVLMRPGFWEIRSIEEIDQIIEERKRNIRGNARALRDFRAIRSAMVAFPGVTAGEAARLAGVKLDVLVIPRAA